MAGELMICPMCHGTRFRVQSPGRMAGQRPIVFTVCASVEDLGCFWRSEPRFETELMPAEPISANCPSQGALTLAE